MGQDREVKLLKLILNEVTAIRRHLDNTVKREAIADAATAENYEEAMQRLDQSTDLRPEERELLKKATRSNGKLTMPMSVCKAVLRDEQPCSSKPEESFEQLPPKDSRSLQSRQKPHQETELSEGQPQLEELA
jgi:hypothetical protein